LTELFKKWKVQRFLQFTMYNNISSAHCNHQSVWLETHNSYYTTIQNIECIICVKRA